MLWLFVNLHFLSFREASEHAPKSYEQEQIYACTDFTFIKELGFAFVIFSYMALH